MEKFDWFKSVCKLGGKIAIPMPFPSKQSLEVFQFQEVRLPVKDNIVSIMNDDWPVEFKSTKNVLNGDFIFYRVFQFTRESLSDLSGGVKVDDCTPLLIDVANDVTKPLLILISKDKNNIEPINEEAISKVSSYDEFKDKEIIFLLVELER